MTIPTSGAISFSDFYRVNAITFGSEVVYNSAQVWTPTVSFDPNAAGKFVVAYKDYGGAGGKGEAVVGTVSGTTVSFGTPVVFSGAALAGDTRIAALAGNAGKFVISYNTTFAGQVVVGTRSGTTGITFGTPAQFVSSTYWPAIAADPNTTGKFAIAYRDNSDSNKSKVKIGTVSGTTISYGSAYTWNTGTFSNVDIAWDPNNSGKFVIAYKDSLNSNKGTAIVGTALGNDGTSVSFGTPVVFYSSSTSKHSISFDPNTTGKFVITFRAADTDYGTSVVGTVSGTTVSFGTLVVFSSQSTWMTTVGYNPNSAGSITVVYRDNGNSKYGTAIAGVVSGTSVSYVSPVIFAAADSDMAVRAMDYDPNTSGKFVVTYADYPNSRYGTAIVGSS